MNEWMNELIKWSPPENSKRLQINDNVIVYMQFLFEGICGRSRYYSEIAIDDISLEDGTCIQATSKGLIVNIKTRILKAWLNLILGLNNRGIRVIHRVHTRTEVQ